MAEAKSIFEFFVNTKVKPQEEVAYPKPFSNEIKFDRNEVLGKSNSVVYRGTYRDLAVAVKRIVVDSLSKEDREIRTQVKLDHENVLKIVTVEQDLDFRYIVLELCEGTLADVINKTYKGPELPSDIIVLNEIATGLDFIHSKKLVHRDIKHDNILISSNGRIKLSDFGLCKETSTNHTFSVSGPLKGTRFWMAQELLNVPSNNSTPIRGSIKSDIFSAGCVFFYFVTRGIHPFGDEDSVQGNIRAGNIVNFDRLNQSHFAWDIIRAMLQHDPNKRIILKEIRNRFDYQPITMMNQRRAANIIRPMLENDSFVISNLPIEKYHATDSLRVDYYVFGKPNSSSQLLENGRRKTILMFESSSETINVINAMINYVLDVKWEDNFRFKLNDEVFRNHKQVTLFHLNEIEGSRLGYPLTIVIDPEQLAYHTRTEGFREQIDIVEEVQGSFRSLTGKVSVEIKQEPDAICFIVPLEEKGIVKLKSTYQEMKLMPSTDVHSLFLNKCRFVANFANFFEFNTSAKKDESIYWINKIYTKFGRGRIAQDEKLYKFICSSVFMLNSHQDVQNRANFEMNVKSFDTFFKNL